MASQLRPEADMLLQSADGEQLGASALRDALNDVEQGAAEASARIRQQRPELEDRSLPHVQRYAESDREPLTWFHSRAVIDAPLTKIFGSAAKRICTFDVTTGRVAVVLMRRYAAHTGLAITTFMVHRLFLAALVVASKAHHDQVAVNGDFAKIYSLQRAELNRLEVAFCVGIDWRAQVCSDDLALPPSPAPLLHLRHVDEMWPPSAGPPAADDEGPSANSFGQLSSASTRRYFDQTRGSLSASSMTRPPPVDGHNDGKAAPASAVLLLSEPA